MKNKTKGILFCLIGTILISCLCYMLGGWTAVIIVNCLVFGSIFIGLGIIYFIEN